MINKKTLKMISLSSIFTLFFTSFANSQVIFAAKTNTTKKHYNISYIYSNKSSIKEKLEYANSKNYDNSKKVTLNEFDLYRQIDNKKGINYTSQNSMVKKYKDAIKNLSSKSDNELKSLGFNASKINALRQSKLVLTNNNLEQIGSTLTLYVDLDAYYHDMQSEPSSPKFKTLIYAMFRWKWSQAPLVNNTDGLGVEWLSNSQDKLQVYRTNDVAQYYNAIYGTLTNDVDYSSQALNNETENKNGLHFNFPFQLNKQARYKIKNALYGFSMNTLVNTNAYVDDFTLYGLYAHSLNSGNPIFSITDNSIDIDNSYKSNAELKSISQEFKYSEWDPSRNQ